jgi:hypothetical protein
MADSLAMDKKRPENPRAMIEFNKEHGGYE